VLVPALGLAYAVALRRFPAPPWRVAAYSAGLALLLAVLVTPLDTIALHYLLSAHLLQNVVLAEWAPLLCVLGLPPALAAALARLPGARRAVHPLVALPAWLATYFLWHLPPLYDAALRNVLLLHLEHGCYFAAGVLLWWPIVHDAPRALRPATRALYLFAAFLLASPLGLLLALLPEPIYAFYEDAPRLWGLSPLADQQLAGLTMAAEEALVFFAAFAFFFARFLREEEAAPDADPARPSGAATRSRVAAPK
jgi:cytochrome c oxidase assembly factor CtaG